MRICFFGKPDSPQLRRVVASLAQRGHQIRVVYHGAGEIPGAVYTPFEIPRAGLRMPYRWQRRQATYLHGFLRDHDVVSIQFLHSWGFTEEQMHAGCFTVRPWGSDVTPPPGGPSPTVETLERRRQMLRHATAVSVTCESFAHTVADFAGIDAADILRTPLGVDRNAFKPQAQPLGPPVVGFIKGFGCAYGAPTLMHAIPRVVRAVPDARFELVGVGPQLAECHELADRLGVQPIIRWLPRLSPERVPEVMQRWSLSIIPSVCESFGIAALESAAAGVPVVATRVGGLVETVQDGVTGLLVPPADSAALADAIIDLLRDDHRRLTLARNGPRFVAARYDWEKCMDAWEHFFAQAVRRAEQVVCAG